jgi:hypothetical protein
MTSAVTLSGTVALRAVSERMQQQQRAAYAAPASRTAHEAVH